MWTLPGPLPLIRLSRHKCFSFSFEPFPNHVSFTNVKCELVCIYHDGIHLQLIQDGRGWVPPEPFLG